MAHKVKALWNVLEEVLGEQDLLSALVVFLGDYCDRGLYTKELLAFLLNLRRQRERRGARTVCLLGNHEFCLLGFLGLLPRPEADPDFTFRETWDRDDSTVGRNERDRWWGDDEEDWDVVEDMHLQGRRWGGDYYERSYGSNATFASYGVEHGDREGLLEAMPEEHLEFLQECPWVHVEEHPILGRLIFVHAGLQADGSENCEEQLYRLQCRDARDPHPEALFGRDSVLHTPPQLARRGTTVISGHHGRVLMRTHRLVVDSCSGDERNPLAALVLPDMLLVHQNGKVQQSDASQVFTMRWPPELAARSASKSSTSSTAASPPAVGRTNSSPPPSRGASPQCSPRQTRRYRHSLTLPPPAHEASAPVGKQPCRGHSMPLGDVSPLE